jgi:hypothetical protein
MPKINSTKEFHRKTSVDLMKEYTINESLSSIDSPYMSMLESPRPFGRIVAEKLEGLGILKQGSSVMEAGGGYGSFMQAMLSSHLNLIRRVVMADLSHDLVKKQRKRLEPFKDMVSFLNADIHEILPAISGVDLIILNEVIGDLDTMTGLDPGALPREMSLLTDKYGLDIPESATFSLNTGAIKAIEEICSKGIPAYISEHSCDPLIPEDMPWLARGLELDGYPREIRLFAHSEYTIRFGHLISVAKYFGRRTMTGSYIDLVGLKRKPSYKFIFETGACSTPEQEIILEFLDHIREYRWLVIL